VIASTLPIVGAAAPATHGWLEHFPEQRAVERVAVTSLPFSVGRAEGNACRLYAAAVSKHHAVLVEQNGRLVLRDLASTNGTFVNGVRIVEQPIVDGDIIHVGPIEICFRSSQANLASSDVLATQALARDVPTSIIRGAEHLRELIDEGAVEMMYQPIVDLRSKEPIGYEALARGTHRSLSRHPAALFALAEQCGMSVELSRLCRREAIRQAGPALASTRLFLNIHPRELTDPGFLASLESLRRHEPANRALVLEIAEACVTDVTTMAGIRDAFARLGFEFAYDDFGAGQARLLELTDIPPHFLKLDMAIVRGIEEARPRQDVVKALLRVLKTLGVRVVAEGIETEACAAVCIDLGCALGQGYFLGRPART
jgi:EAL domain-containing protein (putative c-di-GMP-specific phosphodiesterase class I)